jgi:hypothetical protein
MKWASAKHPAQRAQCKRLIEVLLDITAHRLHCVVFRITASGLGQATQAGTIAGSFGLFSLEKEGYIFSTRTFRWAGRTAIYSGRGNGEHKPAIVAGVTVKDRLPALIFILACHFWYLDRIEYRTVHDVAKVIRYLAGSYPNLAVKAILWKRFRCSLDLSATMNGFDKGISDRDARIIVFVFIIDSFGNSRDIYLG